MKDEDKKPTSNKPEAVKPLRPSTYVPGVGHPPVELTEEQKEVALEMAEQGHTLSKIREYLLISTTAWRNYMIRNPSFKTRFERARFDGLEELADTLQDVADNTQDVLRARLKSDNLKWILSKRKPQTYGDRIDVNVNQTIDIRGALDEAKKRAKLIEQQTEELEDAIIEAQHRVITDTSHEVTTDSESVDDILK